MSVRFGLVLALLFGIFVAYLTALNPFRVRITLAPSAAYDLPLMAVVVGAFVAGACLLFAFTLLRDVGRSFRDDRLARRLRQAEGAGEVYRRGAAAQLAGKLDAATVARTGARGDVLLALAEDYERAGQPAEALAALRRLLDQDPDHRTALRAIRRLAASEGRWAEALPAQEALVRQAAPEERRAELEWLAGIHYEIGKGFLSEGKPQDALRHFRESVRAERNFLPALLALGDAQERMGERREAVRTWERAMEITPAPVLLQRLERVHHAEGRPARMIALYQDALARSPHDLALAFALGRVFFELEMLDEAADQFQKVEVNAPDLPPIHAYLGAIFERRSQSAEAFREYRRALHLTQSFDWPHVCSTCGASHLRWQDRCSACGRWNSSKPSS